MFGQGVAFGGRYGTHAGAVLAAARPIIRGAAGYDRPVIIVLALVLGAITELLLFSRLASAIGLLDAFVTIVLVGAVGAWIAKREGVAGARRVSDAMRAGRAPGPELLDNALVFAAGLALLIPGFLSDAVGLVLLIPPVRRVVAKRAEAALVRRYPVASAMASAPGDSGFAGFARRSQRDDAAASAGAWSFVVRPARGGPDPERREDVLDLDAEEVFPDDPRAELPRGDGRA